MKKLIQTRAFKIIFIIYWIILGLFTIIIFPLSKTQDTKLEASYSYQMLDNWKVDDKKVTMPFVLHDNMKDTYTQTTTLPDKINDKTSIMFLSNYNRYKVYIDDKLIYSYGFIEQLPFGHMTGNVFLMVPLKESYSNKKLSIVTSRVFHLEKLIPLNTYTLPDIYIGDSASFKLDILHGNVWRLVCITFLFALGLISLFFAIYLIHTQTKNKMFREFFYFSALSFCIGGWIFGDSSLLQFITNSNEASSFLTYISLATASIPYLGYCSEILSVGKNLLTKLKWIACLLPFITIITFVTNICDPIHFLTFSQIFIIVSFVSSIIIGIIEWKFDYYSKAFLLSVVVAFVITSLGLIIYFTSNQGESNSISNLIGTGFVVFIFNLFVISVVREIKHSQERKSLDLYKEMAYTDKLTSCGNRAALDEEIQKGLKKHTTLTFVLVDFNHLKEVNDKLGHIIGDKMLRDGAKCLKESFAPSGKIYRLGGDEFAIILWDEQGKIESYYKKLDEKLDHYNKTENITISFAKGYTESKCRDSKDFIDEVYSKADKNMYIDKERCHKLSGGIL